VDAHRYFFLVATVKTNKNNKECMYVWVALESVRRLPVVPAAEIHSGMGFCAVTRFLLHGVISPSSCPVGETCSEQVEGFSLGLSAL